MTPDKVLTCFQLDSFDVANSANSVNMLRLYVVKMIDTRALKTRAAPTGESNEWRTI